MASDALLTDFVTLLKDAPQKRTTWQKACDMLDALDVDEQTLEDDVIPGLNDLLSQWTDDMRPTPQEWVHQLLEGEHVVRMGIARFLDLRGNALILEDAELLAESPELIHIHKLHLAYNGLQDEGIIAFVESPYIKNITSLDLAGNSIGFKGIEALVNSKHLKKLKHLDLTGNWVDDESAFCIAQAQNLASIETLILRGNPIHAEGAKALANSPFLNESVRSHWQSS